MESGASGIAVGDTVFVQVSPDKIDGPYTVEEAASRNRFRCRRQKDGRLTKKISGSLLRRSVASGGASESSAATKPHDRQQHISGPSSSSPKPSRLRRISLSQLTSRNGRDLLLEALECDSLFVLTDLGTRFEKTYSKYLEAVKNFFHHAPTADKTSCISKEVYSNERRVPMWFCGYESTDIRECFRVPGGSAGGSDYITSWPRLMHCALGAEGKNASTDPAVLQAKFQNLWYQLTKQMQAICDKCLSLVLGKAHCKTAESTENDLSVSYTFHYHNAERERLRKAKRGCDTLEDDDMVVTEHCDPSLFIVEPCSEVGGLEVLLRSTNEWSGAEALCIPGKEVIVFCGKALARATERLSTPSKDGSIACPWLPRGGIPATPHRVRFRGGPDHVDDHRFCVIFEQKYCEFYPQ